MKIALTQPIQAHGDTVKEIELATPTGAHIRKCGVPFALEDAGDGSRTVYNAGAVANYISLLGNIPPGSVDQLSAFDFTQLMNGVVSFFAPPSQTKSSGDSGNSENSTET
jgi:hypothetical protein